MVIALLRFLEKKAGSRRGRTTVPKDGYRPAIALGATQTSCAIRGIDGEAFQFGVDHRVSLELMFPECSNPFVAGQHIEFFEGSNLVAVGTILKP